ncbi:hypothetical protein G5714_002730 [Onychostoma macrolepis]|uniref:Fucolectin tachylectin-4 pentraxin-1 domain-containing protein n=1 Tax=Onychostoma macrolepis TaxID=369639 RepID=A0A7J6D7V1_9TELE|nr:hypothetical protein G5714_002730 [Onychostoma macrolepis]
MPRNTAILPRSTAIPKECGQPAAEEYGKPTDGSLRPLWSHTNPETNPWWRVDLLKVYRVNRVTITNRPSFASRINGAEIRIGNLLDIYSNTICGVISTLEAADTATFSCGGMVGRYMVVHIPGDQKTLSIAEAGVYGYLAESMAQALVTAISRELSTGHTQNTGSAPVRPPQRASSNTFTPFITPSITPSTPSTSTDASARVNQALKRQFPNMFSAKSDAKRGKGRISRTVPIKCTDLTVCVLPSPTTLTTKPTVELELAQAGLGKKVVTIAENCKHMDIVTIMEEEFPKLQPLQGRWMFYKATGGATIQSSTSVDWVAERAIDGNRGLQQLYTGCSSTLNETDPWWRLDLHDVYRVSRVVISNRKDCCAEQINGAEIRIGNSLEKNDSNNPICAVIPAIPAGESYSYSCDGLVGRYVIIHVPGDWKILALCEVEVYGYLAENLAVAGAAIQSSTSADWFAEKAIDRGLQQLYTGCSSTLNETDPWWRLDLHDVYRVSRVVVTNRKDCCAEQINGAEIRIGNSLEKNGTNNPICAVIPAIPAGESYSYTCDGMEGRYVNLIIPGDMKILTLCEVKVYGEGPCLKRSFVKLLFHSSKDLTDSTIRENVLKQLGSALADKRIHRRDTEVVTNP